MSGHTLGPWESTPGCELWSKPCPNLLSEIDQLKAANAELAEALQDVIGWIPGRAAWHTNEPIKAAERARAALAKHQKEQA